MSAAKTIDELFMRAMELTDPRERENYLNAACADAPDVRDQVDELLAIAPQMGSFLETPVAPQWAQDTIPQIVADNLCGQSLGPYRLVRLAGEGGMGEVYQAEQEKPMLRQVAIKVIRHGLASVSMLARFAHESHLLGLMDHPNVARVLDTGTTPSGNPFIALEWVEGPYHNVLRSGTIHDSTTCGVNGYGLSGGSARAPKRHHPSRSQAIECVGRAQGWASGSQGHRFWSCPDDTCGPSRTGTYDPNGSNHRYD